jgi:endonuclease/exonuclease/phosphatase family metal-dependent hydrolase
MNMRIGMTSLIIVSIAIAAACERSVPIFDETDSTVVLNLATVEPGPPVTATVVTWNVKGNELVRNPDHLERIAEVLQKIAPDVILLQEIHRETVASAGRDQFAELVALMGMNGCFGRSIRLGEKGAYGNAILSRAPISSATVTRLPGGGEPRTVLQCDSEWGEMRIPLWTTHLTAWDRANRRTRALQADRLAAMASDGYDPLLILGGDFNASASSREMRALTREARLTDAVSDYFVTHRGTGRSYDHLLIAAGWRIREAKVVHEGTSDHWPVVTELEMRIDPVEE